MFKNVKEKIHNQKNKNLNKLKSIKSRKKILINNDKNIVFSNILLFQLLKHLNTHSIIKLYLKFLIG